MKIFHHRSHPPPNFPILWSMTSIALAHSDLKLINRALAATTISLCCLMRLKLPDYPSSVLKPVSQAVAGSSLSFVVARPTVTNSDGRLSEAVISELYDNHSLG
nr:hypothetical protein Iba_chr15bCG10200 [Ipomoea batatas]